MTMTLKVQHLMDATLVISQIIREQRPLPQKGNYRLARMHDKLNREFLIINAKRDEIIKSYETHALVPNPAYQPDESGSVASDVPQFIEDPNNYMVPADKLEEFQKRWEEIGSEEIEVDVQPIPLEQLCFADPNAEASISGHEFIVLGCLVAE